MRIVLVSIFDTGRSGGLSSHVTELATGLARLGHSVRVITPYVATAGWIRRIRLDLPRWPWRVFDPDGAYLYFLATTRRLLARGIVRALADDPVDVVHAHDPVALLAAADATASGLHGSPRLALTVHGDVTNMAASDGAIRSGGRARRRAEGLESEAYRRADVLITVDERLRRHCAHIGGARPTTVFHNFVDTETYRPPTAREEVEVARERDRLGLEPSTRVLLTPRRLVSKNGVVYAVRAMAEPVMRRFAGGRVVLLVAGKGSEHEAVAAEAARLDLIGERGSVRLLGDVSRARLPLLYRLSDLVLVPSIPHGGVVEATSLTALEGMASARVVIASAIGGLADIIEDGRTGVLVPAGQAHALASAIVHVLSDRARARRLGEAARRFVVSERSTERCAADVARLYGVVEGA